MNLTAYHLALLCELAYYDPPERLLPRINCCLTAAMLARALIPLKIGIKAGDPLYEIAKTPAFSKLSLIAYINRNAQSGFVGFAYRANEGVVCVFRGSEPLFNTRGRRVDWLDNLAAPLSGSAQYPDVLRFVMPYANSPKLLLTGHSKGGHNALYALAASENPEAQSRVFNAQGFAPYQLDKAQKARLRARAINYVQQSDVVGALLCHPERQLFVKRAGSGPAHALASMSFFENGAPRIARETLRARLIGGISCTAAALGSVLTADTP